MAVVLLDDEGSPTAPPHEVEVEQEIVPQDPAEMTYADHFTEDHHIEGE